jgi:hypothetical protein
MDKLTARNANENPPRALIIENKHPNLIVPTAVGIKVATFAVKLLL